MLRAGRRGWCSGEAVGGQGRHRWHVHGQVAACAACRRAAVANSRETCWHRKPTAAAAAPPPPHAAASQARREPCLLCFSSLEVLQCLLAAAGPRRAAAEGSSSFGCAARPAGGAALQWRAGEGAERRSSNAAGRKEAIQSAERSAARSGPAGSGAAAGLCPQRPVPSAVTKCNTLRTTPRSCGSSTPQTAPPSQSGSSAPTTQAHEARRSAEGLGELAERTGRRSASASACWPGLHPLGPSRPPCPDKRSSHRVVATTPAPASRAPMRPPPPPASLVGAGAARAEGRSMLGNNNAGLDNRFAQFAGQGQPGGGTGFPGLGGNMQALQSLQAGGFGLQNPLQGGRWVAWRGGGGGGGGA